MSQVVLICARNNKCTLTNLPPELLSAYLAYESMMVVTQGHYDVMGVASPLLTAHSCLDISLLTPVPNWPGLGAANWLLPGKQPTQLSHQPGHWEGPSLVTSH